MKDGKLNQGENLSAVGLLVQRSLQTDDGSKVDRNL